MPNDQGRSESGVAELRPHNTGFPGDRGVFPSPHLDGKRY
jgi:hypothetical protein